MKHLEKIENVAVSFGLRFFCSFFSLFSLGSLWRPSADRKLLVSVSPCDRVTDR